MPLEKNGKKADTVQRFFGVFALISLVPLAAVISLVFIYVVPAYHNPAYMGIVLAGVIISIWTGCGIAKRIIAEYGTADRRVKGASAGAGSRRGAVSPHDRVRAEAAAGMGASFSEVSISVVNRLTDTLQGGFAAVFTKKISGKYQIEAFSDTTGRHILYRSLEKMLPRIEGYLAGNEYISSGFEGTDGPWGRDLSELSKDLNMILFPLNAGGKTVGIIALGDYSEHTGFEDTHVELLRGVREELLAGHENSVLRETFKDRDFIEKETGLFTFTFLKEQLQEELARSLYYQNPCSLLIADIDGFHGYTARYGDVKTKQAIKKVLAVIKQHIPPEGKVARMDSGGFGILLPETSKKKATWIAEELRLGVEALKLSPELDDRITITVGVGENPIDGSRADQIIEKAKKNVHMGRITGNNQVVAG